MIFLSYNIIFRQMGLVFSLYKWATLIPSGSPTMKPTIGHTAIHFWNGLLRELYIDASHFLGKLFLDKPPKETKWQQTQTAVM